MGKKRDATRMVPPLGLWRRAKQFADAARPVRSSAQSIGNVDIVEYYLLGHAIELALKAFIASTGANEAQLMALGHDLEEALASAEEKALGQHITLTQEDRAAVAIVNRYYRQKDFEYYEPGQLMGLPKSERMQEVIKKLLTGTEGPIMAATRHLYP